MGQAPLDYNRVLEEFEDDKEFLAEVINGFIDNSIKQLEIISKAIENSDAETIAREAHSIKGAALNLAADMLADIALELENIGKSGSLQVANDVLDRLRLEFDKVIEFNESLSTG